MHHTSAAVLFCFGAVLSLYAPGTSAREGYGVNPGDVLRVFVWNEETLSSEVLVAPDGFISVNMIGRVDVLGLTTSEVEDRVREGLNRYLKNEPLVTISLLTAEGSRIFVQGAVTRPGAYGLPGRMDVVQALSLAGGVTPFAKTDSIKVVRRDREDRQQLFTFDYDEFKKGKNLAGNIILEPGDVVVVP